MYASEICQTSDKRQLCISIVVFFIISLVLVACVTSVIVIIVETPSTGSATNTAASNTKTSEATEATEETEKPTTHVQPTDETEQPTEPSTEETKPTEPATENSSVKYGIVVDLGSSGSRLHIFTYNEKVGGSSTKAAPDKAPFWSMAIHPSVSSYSDPKLAASSLKYVPIVTIFINKASSITIYHLSLYIIYHYISSITIHLPSITLYLGYT